MVVKKMCEIKNSISYLLMVSCLHFKYQSTAQNLAKTLINGLQNGTFSRYLRCMLCNIHIIQSQSLAINRPKIVSRWTDEMWTENTLCMSFANKKKLINLIKRRMNMNCIFNAMIRSEVSNFDCCLLPYSVIWMSLLMWIEYERLFLTMQPNTWCVTFMWMLSSNVTPLSGFNKFNIQ